MAVPNIFGTATAAIPLSQLDTNFATAITLGNTAVYLGNTTTSLGNLTLTNVTISSGTSNITTNVATVTGTLPEANGGTGTTTGYYGFKNRIINGAMVIDQRNAGAAVTVNTAARNYGVDRFFGYGEAADGVFTIQQDTDVPTGFKNSLKVTTTTADASVGASQFYILGQSIEGFNFYDLDWGTANAKTITLSFWVRSSLTGQFGGSLTNNANNRSYPYSYTINAANTWEQKSVTIAGDTTGTWLGASNLIGVNVWFDLGCGSSNIGTAGAWAGAGYYGATGDTKLISTLSANLYITGVQLEKGSTTTSFDYRPYGTELALCQRYYVKYNNAGAKAVGYGSGVNSTLLSFITPVQMRVTPTFTAGTSATTRGGDASVAPTGYSVASVQANIVQINASYSGLGTANRVFVFTSTDGTELSAEL